MTGCAGHCSSPPPLRRGLAIVMLSVSETSLTLGISKESPIVIASLQSRRGNRTLRVTQVVDCHARAACSQGRGAIAPLLCVDWHSKTALQIRKLIHAGRAESAGQIHIFAPPLWGHVERKRSSVLSQSIVRVIAALLGRKRELLKYKQRV